MKENKIKEKKRKEKKRKRKCKQLLLLYVGWSEQKNR